MAFCPVCGMDGYYPQMKTIPEWEESMYADLLENGKITQEEYDEWYDSIGDVWSCRYCGASDDGE